MYVFSIFHFFSFLPPSLSSFLNIWAYWGQSPPINERDEERRRFPKRSC